jgi:hypothetical protein
VVYVCNTIPLQNIEVGKLGFSCWWTKKMEVDKSDECCLHVTSHPTTSQFAFIFEDSTGTMSAQQRLEKAKNKVRANKVDQVEIDFLTTQMRQIDCMLSDG